LAWQKRRKVSVKRPSGFLHGSVRHFLLFAGESFFYLAKGIIGFVFQVIEGVAESFFVVQVPDYAGNGSRYKSAKNNFFHTSEFGNFAKFTAPDSHLKITPKQEKKR
jgi:hypothetical protein